MIKLFSLLNGREIIGRVLEETDTYFVLERPIGLFVKPVGEDASGEPRNELNVEPISLFLGAEECPLPKSAICFGPMIPREDIEQTYKQVTSPIIQSSNTTSGVATGFVRN